jgi:hypothetical protein
MICKFFLKIGVIVFLSCALFSVSFAMDDENNEKELQHIQKKENDWDQILEIKEELTEETYLLNNKEEKKESIFLFQNKGENKPKEKKKIKSELKEGEVGFWISIKGGLSDELEHLTPTFDTCFLAFNTEDIKNKENLLINDHSHASLKALHDFDNTFFDEVKEPRFLVKCCGPVSLNILKGILGLAESGLVSLAMAGITNYVIGTTFGYERSGLASNIIGGVVIFLNFDVAFIRGWDLGSFFVEKKRTHFKEATPQELRMLENCPNARIFPKSKFHKFLEYVGLPAAAVMKGLIPTAVLVYIYQGALPYQIALGIPFLHFYGSPYYTKAKKELSRWFADHFYIGGHVQREIRQSLVASLGELKKLIENDVIAKNKQDKSIRFLYKYPSKSHKEEYRFHWMGKDPPDLKKIRKKEVGVFLESATKLSEKINLYYKFYNENKKVILETDIKKETYNNIVKKLQKDENITEEEMLTLRRFIYLNQLKPGEIGIFCENNILYGKVHTDKKVKITKSSQKGIHPNTYQRIVEALKNNKNIEKEDQSEILKFLFSKKYISERGAFTTQLYLIVEKLTKGFGRNKNVKDIPPEELASALSAMLLKMKSSIKKPQNLFESAYNTVTSTTVIENKSAKEEIIDNSSLVIMGANIIPGIIMEGHAFYVILNSLVGLGPLPSMITGYGIAGVSSLSLPLEVPMYKSTLNKCSKPFTPDPIDHKGVRRALGVKSFFYSAASTAVVVVLFLWAFASTGNPILALSLPFVVLRYMLLFGDVSTTYNEKVTSVVTRPNAKNTLLKRETKLYELIERLQPFLRYEVTDDTATQIHNENFKSM